MTTPQDAAAHIPEALRSLDTTQERAAFPGKLTYPFYDHAKPHIVASVDPTVV